VGNDFLESQDSTIRNSTSNSTKRRSKSPRTKKSNPTNNRNIYAVNQQQLDDIYDYTEDANFDDETMDILWDMVMEDDAVDSVNVGQDMTELLHDSGLGDMLAEIRNDPLSDDLQNEASLAAAAASAVSAFEKELRAAAEGSRSGDNAISVLGAEIAAAVEAAVEDSPMRFETEEVRVDDEVLPEIQDQLEYMLRQHETIDRQRLGFANGREDNEPLPSIADFSPVEMHVGEGSKILVCCSAPLSPVPHEDNDSMFTWHTLVAFVAANIDRPNEISESTLVDLAPASILNPYTFRCFSPKTAKWPGKRRIIALGVRLYAGTDPVCEGVAASVASALAASQKKAAERAPHDQISPFFTIDSRESMNSSSFILQILSQFSDDYFHFKGM